MIVLARHAYTKDGTFGKVYVNEWSCYTVERPWVWGGPGGVRNRSCVPEGEYDLVEYESRKHGKTFALTKKSPLITPTDVEGCARWGILIHAANLARQVEGCIAPGLGTGCLDGQWSVTASRDATKELLRRIRGQSGRTLTIVHEAGRAGMPE